MKSVAILLSTYNGEKYIQEQIDSLLAQTYKNIKIFVRDDGSTDNTINVLKKYGNKITLINGKNVGIIESFKKLLANSGTFDYYSFCDQDDIWEKNKIEIAIQKFNNCNCDIPVLYASSYDVYDANMNFLYSAKNKKNISFVNSLFETISPGMTMVFNKNARDILLETLNKNCDLHDSWLYKVCAGLGKVIYDSEKSVKYRRYEGTFTVTKNGFISNLKWNFNYFINGNHWNKTYKLLNYYKQCFYDKLDNDSKNLISLFTTKKSILKQIKKIFYRKRFKDSILSEIKLRFMFLIWKI